MADGAGNAGPAVLVIGAGFAGCAAAWAARRGGKSVQVVHGRAGSSALYSGVADGAPGDAEQQELAREFGLALAEAPRAVATREGLVRLVHGRDRALLDLSRVAGGEVRVLDLCRDDWDAELLARSFASSPWARTTNTRFVSHRLEDFLQGPERRIAAFDLARRLEQGTRAIELADRLHGLAPNADAWLLGPWLGLERDLAHELASALGCPVGETTSAPGGVAGARFELRREALPRALRVTLVTGQVLAVSELATGVTLQLADGATVSARRAVLAFGGVAAGGIRLEQASATSAGWVSAVHVPVPLWLGGEAVDPGSSAWGVSFQRLGFGALDRVGFKLDAALRVAGLDSSFACGDLVTGRPRTVFEALRSGIAAGRAAAIA